MISIEDLEKRKVIVEEDIAKVKDAIQNLESQKDQLSANLHALQGALLQCDYFIEEVRKKEEKKK